jgi:hypothetical protein
MNAWVAYGLQREGGLSAAFEKSLQIGMELAGLEPATSWVRCMGERSRPVAPVR